MDALSLISQEPLDTSSPTPLYRQLKHRILQLIATGALDAKTPLPTEEALCSAFGLSRSTVRRCFKDLVDEGYVTRRRGQGTFAAVPGGAGGLDTLFMQVSTSNSIERSGAVPGSRILRVRALTAERGIALRLGIAEGTRVWEVNRLRLADNKPVMHEVAYVACELCPALDQRDFDRSLYEYIAEASGVMPAATDELIEAVVLDRHEAKLLGTMVGAPGMRIVATSFSVQGEPFETSVGIARADRFQVKAHYAGDGTRFAKTLC